MSKIVFLDRDGVLNELVEDGNFRAPRTTQELKISKGAPEAVLCLSNAGYKIVVVTNQPDISRNLNTVQNVTKINSELKNHIPQISDFKICFHDDLDMCTCRKPKPGLILESISEIREELSEIWMIGDRATDVLAGKKVNAMTVLIQSGIEETEFNCKPDFTARNLLEASKIIVFPFASTNSLLL